MAKHQISTRALILLVLTLAIAFAAMVSATPFWAAAIRSVVLFPLTLALGGGLCDQSQRRAFWIGLALFGWSAFLPVAKALGHNDALAGQAAHQVTLWLHPHAERAMTPAGTPDEVVSFDASRQLSSIDAGGKAATAERILGDLFALIYGVIGGFSVALRGRRVAEDAALPHRGRLP